MNVWVSVCVCLCVLYGNVWVSVSVCESLCCMWVCGASECVCVLLCVYAWVSVLTSVTVMVTEDDVESVRVSGL